MLTSRNIKVRICRLLDIPVVRNFLVFGTAETSVRAVRILSMVVIARIVDAQTFGLAALLLTSHELIKVGAQIGTGQAIVRADDEDLPAVCETAWRLNWAVCLCLAAIQVLVAFIMGRFLNEPAFFALGAALALVFIGMPFGLVHVFRALRRQRADQVAGIAASQSIADSLLSVVLAICGLGVWAIVLPKVLTLPIWIFGARKTDSWKRDARQEPTAFRPLLRFGLPILASEALTVLRNQGDKLIVGATLGVEALGIWYVASSAGLGLAQAIASAFSLVLLPHLCADNGKSTAIERFDRFVQFALPPMAVLFVLQAMAAPIYVPIIFGQQWALTSTTIAVLCLLGPSRILVESAVQLARANGRSDLDAICNVVITSGMLLGLFIGSLTSLFIAAVFYAVAGSLLQIGAAFFISIQFRISKKIQDTTETSHAV